ncbi:putative protein FAM135B [Cocos nucifera]|uniref:DUF676 domain-containing protein n=1 Tax=Cocos nucifera TaxID=13894 RepID=A0A8K0NCN0_COCNU|nr:putative protein FAM135B [Cocos nucifera]
MFRRIRRFIGLNLKSPPPKRLLNAEPPTSQQRATIFNSPNMLETVHEIAIYVHRFHNLDLFQQGWYQIKISARWEDNNRESPGTPARVVQYEAPDVALDEIFGVWRIDDADHSFSTQPFRVKYARQDLLLSVMVSFNLTIGEDESPSASAVILKFELMYAPILENGSEMQASFDAVSAAVHEFRIPPKGLLGLHSYCPVHFDAFHAVLVDLSIHVVFLKAGTYARAQKVSSTSQMVENHADEHYEEPNQILGQGWIAKAIELVKLLLASRELLLEELRRISKAIDQTIEDLNNADLNLGRFESISSSTPDSSTSNLDISGMKMGVGQLVGMLHNILEKKNGVIEFGNDVILYTLSKEELLDVYFTVGNQLSFIWNAFLKFHRINKIRIIEYLYDAWASDRKAEWSIWMVHSKIEIPHHYLGSGVDDSYHRNGLGKVGTPWKSKILKMVGSLQINSQSIQDMQIFGDPSHVPVILVEQHIMNFPLHGSGNSSPSQSLKQHDTAAIPAGAGEKTAPKFGFGARKEANEEKTSGDFREMGSRLAEEVIAFIRRKMDKLSRHGGCKDIKLSFVGHSIGNIIIRTALTESIMAPFLKHLHTYMSVSGPHLGYWYSSNSLFNSGLWLLKKLKGAQCMHQLTFSDDPDLQNTFFYKLCKVMQPDHLSEGCVGVQTEDIREFQEHYPIIFTTGEEDDEEYDDEKEQNEEERKNFRKRKEKEEEKKRKKEVEERKKMEDKKKNEEEERKMMKKNKKKHEKKTKKEEKKKKKMREEEEGKMKEEKEEEDKRKDDEKKKKKYERKEEEEEKKRVLEERKREEEKEEDKRKEDEKKEIERKEEEEEEKKREQEERKRRRRKRRERMKEKGRRRRRRRKRMKEKGRGEEGNGEEEEGGERKKKGEGEECGGREEKEN